MSGKGLDSYLDQLSKDVGSTSLPDVLSSLLKPRKPRSTKQSEQEMDEIKQKVNMIITLSIGTHRLEQTV